LAGFGIGVFGILQSLKVVHGAEAEFVSNCMIVDQYGGESAPIGESTSFEESREASWKRAAKAMYAVIFLMVWIGGVASFYFFGMSFKNGSPERTTS